MNVSPEQLAAQNVIMPNGHGQNVASWADMALYLGPIAWDWADWLPRGLLTILAAESGKGKSLLALRIAACFLRGDPWPDGTPYTGELGSVLWAEAEAAQALNLERARAWNLPLDRILTPLSDPLADVSFDDPQHQEAIAAVASRPDVRFLVFDSLSGGNRRDENSSEILGVVRWLAQLARDTGKAALLSHHLRKRSLSDGTDKVGLERLRGSSAIVQMSRLVWALDAPDANDEDTRRVSVIKSNLAKFPEPVGMRIADGGVVFVNAPEPPHSETQMERATDLLRALLTRGPRLSTELLAEAEGAGISKHTARRAQERLGIVPRRDGKTGRWFWALPGQEVA